MICFIDYLYRDKLKEMAKKESKESGFALGKENYKLMAIGFAFIVVGFILMAGGGSDDPNVFNPDIFSFRRLTIAPILLLFGFLFEIYAIMKKPKSDS